MIFGITLSELSDFNFFALCLVFFFAIIGLIVTLWWLGVEGFFTLILRGLGNILSVFLFGLRDILLLLLEEPTDEEERYELEYGKKQPKKCMSSNNRSK